jgi:triacylglycerol lipase
MMKKVLIGIIVLLFVFPVVSMASSTKCATKYPIVLSHGMGAEANILGIINYWGSIPSTLKSNGANVYVTSVSAMASHAYKAGEWATQVKQIMAVSGASKINVIGHSDGCIYTRYAISNMGMAPYVASHTSMGGPHRGSYVADWIMNLGSTTGLTSLLGDAINWVYSFVFNDYEDSIANGIQETRAYMINIYNPNTPNVASVYYQSYGGKITNILGGGLMSATWALMLPVEGDNDGLVSTTSAKWGNYRGTLDGGFWSFLGGVNHLAEVGLLTLTTPGYDAPTQFVNIASDLKSRGY